MEILSSLPALFTTFAGGINLLDIVILCIVLFYVHEGYSLGFSLATLDLLSFIISFIAALQFYNNVAFLLTTFFALPLGIANALGFFLTAFISEIVLTILFRRSLRFLPSLPKGKRFTDWFQTANHWLGIVPGIISAFIIIAFLLTVVITFPTSPLIKNAVADSAIGSQFIANTALFESRLNSIFGGALNDTLNFLTVKPQSDETVKLHYTVKNGNVDPDAETEMLRRLNTERVKQGLTPLAADSALQDVARLHSLDMFERGYFSHYTPEGLSPFDRMEQANISYGYAGENLALAPTTALAMQGLMNSPGHRANILSPNFTKVGIGVIDGGIYGKMYSQEFSD